MLRSLRLRRAVIKFLFNMKDLTIIAFVLLSCSAKNQSIVDTNEVEKIEIKGSYDIVWQNGKFEFANENHKTKITGEWQKWTS